MARVSKSIARLPVAPAPRGEVLEQVGARDHAYGHARARHDDGRAPAREVGEDLVDRLRELDRRQRRLHRLGHVLVERVAVAEDALEQPALADRADHVRERLAAGSWRTTGICEIP